MDDTGFFLVQMEQGTIKSIINLDESRNCLIEEDHDEDKQVRGTTKQATTFIQDLVGRCVYVMTVLSVPFRMLFELCLSVLVFIVVVLSFDEETEEAVQHATFEEVLYCNPVGRWVGHYMVDTFLIDLQTYGNVYKTTFDWLLREDAPYREIHNKIGIMAHGLEKLLLKAIEEEQQCYYDPNSSQNDKKVAWCKLLHTCNCGRKTLLNYSDMAREQVWNPYKDSNYCLLPTEYH